MKIRNYALLICLALVLVSSFYSQALAQERAVSLHLDWIDTTAFPTVTVRLSAWDADGLPLAGLLPGDFTLQEDGGAPLRLLSVRADAEAPLSVALVLDVSTSMYGAPLDDAQEAATRFLDRLQTGDRAALIAFSDGLDPDPANLNPMRELDFSADLDPVYDRIAALQADGQTHLYNATAKAVGMIADEPQGHRAIILLTDGRNEPAEVGDPEEAIRLAKEANVPFFVIGLGKDVDEPYLRRLAVETGGLFRAAPTSSELAHLFSDLADLLKTQYLLTYQSQLPADGGMHTLSVTLKAAGGTHSQALTFGPLPLATPTEIPPTETPTTQHSPTEAPTSTPLPTATPLPPTLTTTPLPTPTPTPVPTFVETAARSPWTWLGLGVIVLLVLWWLLFARRKPKPKPEKCAKCGYDMTGKPGACPQCGGTRRLPKV